MDDFMNQAVTVSVITYNSSKFVLETLESIKAQTYKNLILRICDDCSTDNTVAICREWIEKNKSRFVETDIIVPDHNTGVSANCNRAWDACATKYQKEIAGDDILLPNCISDNMECMWYYNDAAILFSRIKSFGADRKCCENFDKAIRYDMFDWSTEKQYEGLYNRTCFPPAPACFVNIEELRRCGLRHDERIPMIEDSAKWINALRLGLRLRFLAKETVLYRIHDGSLSLSALKSPKFVESEFLYWLYYYFETAYASSPNDALQCLVSKMMSYYNMYYGEVKSIRMSKRFRLLSLILKPFDFVGSQLRNRRWRSVLV